MLKSVVTGLMYQFVVVKRSKTMMMACQTARRTLTETENGMEWKSKKWSIHSD
ncbi:hypothetical protein [Peribacillus sp. SCS-155]|uniref:hypothetical protein n=1 Tax=Peribacillus sedimenti TaxID=3115297 RepID=UPI003906A517